MEQFVVGLMSGTSVDGVDAALIRVTPDDPGDFSLVEFISKPFTLEQRDKILRVCDPRTATLPAICELNFELGEVFAQTVLDLLRKAGVKSDQVACIGSHGQTIFHIPGKSTLQIGEPSIIARRTGIVTIADFRPADIAAGGQGAPLVPFFDQLVFAQDGQTSAVQNIGGIGNVTVVGKDTKALPWIAFDTGPGNMIMDFMAERASGGILTYDQDGRLAAEGLVHEEVVCDLLTHPYFRLSPPKSTGRELFGAEFSQELVKRFSLKPKDWVATATAFTAASIADSYRQFVLPFCKLDRIIVAGGGSQNPTLLKELEERSGLPVFTHESFGISSEAKEAIAFALLAHATLHHRPSNVPRATGAKEPVILGKIVYP